MGEQQENAGLLDARLIALCAGLWVLAGVILWQSWPDTKRDYYWGNIMTGLQSTPPHVDEESIDALAAQGDAIVPICSKELSHWNPAFRIAVIKVAEKSNGKGSHELIEWAVTHDRDPNVSANALFALRSRLKTHPEDLARLKKLAFEVMSNESNDLHVRATAALVLAEQGDRRPVIDALLVWALREPLMGPPGIAFQAANELAAIDSTIPKVSFQVRNANEYLHEVVACEKWLKDHEIALVASAIVIPVDSGTRAGGNGK